MLQMLFFMMIFSYENFLIYEIADNFFQKKYSDIRIKIFSILNFVLIDSK